MLGSLVGGSRSFRWVGGIRLWCLVAVVLSCASGSCAAADLKFDDPTAGFFLRTVHQTNDPSSSPASGKGPNGSFTEETAAPTDGYPEFEEPSGPTPTRQFTLLKSGQSATLKADYGPFYTSQSVVSPRLSLPQETLQPELNGYKNLSVVSSLVTNNYLDLSAHLVTQEVRKDNPVLRVVFHTGQPIRTRRKGSVCVVVSAQLNNRSVEATCTPQGEDGTCLGELTVPASWWPSLTTGPVLSTTTPQQFNSNLNAGAHHKLAKQPKVVAHVVYWLSESPNDCQQPVPPLGGGGSGPALHDVAGSTGLAMRRGDPVRYVGDVALTVSQVGYRQLAGDEILHLLIPQTPLYPGSQLYVPVFLEQPRDSPHGIVGVFVVKCRAKKGVRILGVEETSPDWTLRVELNSRRTSGTVTAFRRDASFLSSKELSNTGPEEIFNWLFGIDPSEKQVWEGGRLSWQVKYRMVPGHASVMADQTDSPADYEDDFHEDNAIGLNAAFNKGPRLRHKLEVKKDDVQGVIPISKSWELLNTAVLTGRQVSQPMKVYIVSQAGEIADVTLHTSCHTTDDSALKVSSSCSSVYVDGSETRGAIAAQVQVKYGTLSGLAVFRVWMPEIPVIVEMSDSKLSLINHWNVPNAPRMHGKRSTDEDESDWRDQVEERLKMDEERERQGLEQLEERAKQGFQQLEQAGQTCHNRYQQAEVKVFARFLAEDPDSGRRDHFISWSTQLELTHLTLKSLRTSDPRIASVHGHIVKAHQFGRAEVQVVSPVTGRVIGTSEIRVVKSKETVTGLTAQLITGLHLSVSPVQQHLPTDTDIFSVETHLSNTLTSKYQEGLLDLRIEYSDGTSTALRDVDPSDYYLTVDSLDPSIIAFAPKIGSKDPRVIAVGAGEGPLLAISLELADECHDKLVDPLAITSVYVNVQLNGNSSKDATTASSNNIPQHFGKQSIVVGSKPGIGGFSKEGRRPSRNKDRGRYMHQSGYGGEKQQMTAKGVVGPSAGGSIKSVDMGDLSEILSNIALRDDNSRDNTGLYRDAARPGLKTGLYNHYGSNDYNTRLTAFGPHHQEATTLEIGMYILLGVFCVAIAVFMASCFVYANKHGRKGPESAVSGLEPRHKSRSVQNAHDWVWLGRQTLDKTSLATSGSRDQIEYANSILSRDSTNRGHGGYGGSSVVSAREIVGPHYLAQLASKRRFLPSPQLNIITNPAVSEERSYLRRQQLQQRSYLMDQFNDPTNSTQFGDGGQLESANGTNINNASNHSSSSINSRLSNSKSSTANVCGSADIYAELPRRRSPRFPRKEMKSGGHSGSPNKHRRNNKHPDDSVRYRPNGDLTPPDELQSPALPPPIMTSSFWSRPAPGTSHTAHSPPQPRLRVNALHEMEEDIMRKEMSAGKSHGKSQHETGGIKRRQGGGEVDSRSPMSVTPPPTPSSSSKSTPQSSPERGVVDPAKARAINSATYTRQKPVQPLQGDVLPVGFPIFCSQQVNAVDGPWNLSGSGDQTRFDNPWDALHCGTDNHVASNPYRKENLRQNYFFEEDEDTDLYSSNNLHLDLKEADDPPYYLVNKQSPASALPRLASDRGAVADAADATPPAIPSSPSQEKRQLRGGCGDPPPQAVGGDPGRHDRALFITPDLIQQPSGGYIPLNPDIEKAHPPRYGGRRLYSDPFNLSDEEAPPVPTESLSPSHVFGSVSDLHRSIVESSRTPTGEMSMEQSVCSQTASTPTSPLDDDDEDECQSVVSAKGLDAHRAMAAIREDDTASVASRDAPFRHPSQYEAVGERPSQMKHDGTELVRPDLIELPPEEDSPGLCGPPRSDSGTSLDSNNMSSYSSGHGSLNTSPFATYSKVNKVKKPAAAVVLPEAHGNVEQAVVNASADADHELNNVAIGQLDYDQLMQYFETLKESAA